ncbi:MAG TPA: M50 family metallopeptidase [Arthrobacter sp.]
MQFVMDLFALLGEKMLAGLTRAEPPAFPLWEVLVVVLGAAALCLPAAWRYFGLFTTLVHELGHAVAGISAGRFVTGIRIHRDHSGETHSYGPVGASAVWSTFWGYPVPAAVGGALLWAALAGWAQTALSLSALILVLALPAVRNLFGAVVVLGCSSASLAMVWTADPLVTAHVTLAVGVALLAGSLRSFGEVLLVHSRYPEDLDSSDAHILAQATGVPAAVWLLLLGAVLGGCWYATLASAVPLLLAAG